MTESDGLRCLQVREPRHNGGRMRARHANERALIVGDSTIDPVDGIAHPKPEVRGHLVIARAGRVQSTRRRADDLLQALLDIHVNVLEFARKDELPGIDLGPDLVQPRDNGPCVLLCDNAALGQHARMGLRGHNVLGV